MTTKLEFLNSVANKNTEFVMASQPVIHMIGTKKKFITFPYAYMNGKLHLGHALTILNADIQARFYKLNGYNVLFPFGYHGSGMPIVSSAIKLSREVELTKNRYQNITEEYVKTLESNNQLKIMYEMNIGLDNIEKFSDPYYWITYFSEEAYNDVKKLNPYIDFTRSFFTTDMNPYYDSFIKWQFNHLIRKGLVYKGVRNMIYSELDSQPCADHDRSIGENVDPIKIIAYIHNQMLITEARSITDANTDATTNTNVKILFSNTKYVKIKLLNQIVITSESSYRNIRNQFITEFIENVNIEELEKFGNVTHEVINWGTGIYAVNDDLSYTKINEQNQNQNVFEYYEPESQVVSRSGDVCVVAKTEQWFIDYGNPELKEKVKRYVTDIFYTPNASVKETLLNAIENMHERACSRNYGLGTKLPGTDYIIDSLSDSTIYMAFYTVSHLLMQININEITDSTWNYIFLGIGNSTNEIISRARDEFVYWYPVDIRVSGKDLIFSHLTYTMFNHMAIWDSNAYMPRSYYINGHLLLNGKKMAKSTGNFLTLSDSIKLYGSDAVRFALACSDGIEDANFTDANVTTANTKLYNELMFIQDNISNNTELNKNYLQFEYFEHRIKESLKLANLAYINAVYSDVIKYFYALIATKDEYVKKTKSINKNMMQIYSSAIYTLIYPICPTYASEIEIIAKQMDMAISINWYETYHNPNIRKYEFYNNVVKYVKNEINLLNSKMKKSKYTTKSQKILVTVIRNFSEEEKQIIANIDNIKLFLDGIADKKKMGMYKGFATHVINNIEEFGKEWIEWTTLQSLDEYEYIKNEIEYDVVLVDEKPECQFKNNPGRPKVTIQNY